VKNGTRRIFRALVPLALSLSLSSIAISVVIKVSFTSETLDALRAMDRLVFLYCFLLVVTAWACNGIRLKILTAALGYKIPLPRCIRITLSSEFGIAATPSGVGGGVLKIYLIRQQGIPVGGAMSMFTTDMTLDLLFTLIVIPLGISSFLTIFRPILRKPGEVLPVILGLLVVVAAITFAYLRFRATRNNRAAGDAGLTRPKGLRGLFTTWRRLLRKWAGEFHSGFSTLLRLRKLFLVAAFLVSVVQWSCRYGVLVLVLRALGAKDFNPFALFILQGLLFLGSLILVLPGGGGGVEAAFGLTVSQLVPGNIVGVALLLWRFFTYYLYLIGGGIMLLVTAGKGAFTRSLEPLPEDLPPAG